MNERFAQGYAVDWQVCVSVVCLVPRRTVHELVLPSVQDLISRFTMDASTEFLFGANVDSLGAGIPYPPTSTAAKEKKPSHPANRLTLDLEH